MDLWFIICKRCGNDKKRNEGQKVKHQMKIQKRVSGLLLLLEYSEGPVQRNCSTHAQLFRLRQ